MNISLDKKAIPLTLRKLIDSHHWQPVTIGESGAQVIRLMWGQQIRYLKIAPDLQAEAERLRWLQGRVPVPQVLHEAKTEEQHFLLLSELQGLMPFHDNLDWTPEQRIDFLAQAAQRFHSLLMADCPYIRKLDTVIAEAAHHVQAGTVREDHFDKERAGRTAADLLEELQRTRPTNEDLVVVHGDLYPVNIIANPKTQALVGYLDVGRMGIADRYVDLALIANAIRWHYGETYLERFFTVYGVPIDKSKLAYYALLDEFF